MNIGKTITTLSLVVGILVGLATLWQIYKPGPQLVVRIITVKAPLPPRLEENIDQLSELSLENTKALLTELKDAEIYEDEFAKFLEAYKKFVESQEDRLKDYNFLGDPYLLVLSIQNRSNSSLSNVFIRNKFFTDEIAIIEKESGQISKISFTGKLDIGNLSPKENVTVYIYLDIAGVSIAALTVHHSNGEAEVYSTSQLGWEFPGGSGNYVSWQNLFYLVFLALIVIVIEKAIGPYLKEIFKRNT